MKNLLAETKKTTQRMPAKTLSHQEKLDNAFTRLKLRIERQVNPFGVFTCKIITPGEGVVKNKHANTYKVSFGKKKKLAHRVAYEKYHGRISDDLDISHLCHNECCIAKSHLHQENHGLNMARIGCPGWCKPHNKDYAYLCCNHKPTCKKLTVVPFTRVKLSQNVVRKQVVKRIYNKLEH